MQRMVNERDAALRELWWTRRVYWPCLVAVVLIAIFKYYGGKLW
jgi:hypothetical protein